MPLHLPAWVANHINSQSPCVRLWCPSQGRCRWKGDRPPQGSTTAWHQSRFVWKTSSPISSFQEDFGSSTWACLPPWSPRRENMESGEHRLEDVTLEDALGSSSPISCLFRKSLLTQYPPLLVLRWKQIKRDGKLRASHISPFFFEVTLLPQKSYLRCFIDSLTIYCASRKHGTQSHRLSHAVPSLLPFCFLH